MGQAKLRKAEIDALKNKSPKMNFSFRNTSGVFSWHDEYAKMKKVTADSIGATCSTADDFASLPFGKFEAGFFVCEVKLVNGGVPAREGQEQLARELMDGDGGFNVTRVGNSMVLTTFCSFDRVWEHYQCCFKALGFTLIGFSTPSRLHILAEHNSWQCNG